MVKPIYDLNGHLVEVHLPFYPDENETARIIEEIENTEQIKLACVLEDSRGQVWKVIK